MGLQATIVYAIQILDGVLDPYLSEYSWFCGSTSTLQVVAQLEPNGYGIFEVSGNVLEWTHDIFDCDVPASNLDPYSSPQRPSYISNYVVYNPMKGGHFGMAPTNTKVTVRHFALSAIQAATYGFRVVRSKL